MVDDLAEWWVHFIEIERLEGGGAFGESFAAREVVKGFYDDTRKFVRTSSGVETLASARVMLPIGVVDIPIGSNMRGPTAMAGERFRKVISVSVREAGDLPVPEHVEIFLE